MSSFFSLSITWDSSTKNTRRFKSARSSFHKREYIFFLPFRKFRLGYLVYFFGGVVKIFFLPLGHQVIQVAQLPLGEAQVQHFSNENQSEHLETRKHKIPFVKMETEKQRTEGRVGGSAHHHGKNNGSGRRLDHPEQHQARELGDGEQVNLSQWDVPQVDEVWLVLCRHAEQLEAVKELRKRASGRDVGDRTDEKQMDRELKI